MDGTDGFNEAEAIKPRNPAGSSTCRRRTMRFNEAEAIKPRNLPGTTGINGGGRRRFNEAEAIKPRNPGREPDVNRKASASMRPRQSSLGIKSFEERHPQDIEMASMRPRQSSLGIGQPVHQPPFHAPLQ